MKQLTDVQKIASGILLAVTVLWLKGVVVDYRSEKAEYLESVKRVCILHTALGFNKESGCNVILGQRFFRMWYAENMQ